MRVLHVIPSLSPSQGGPSVALPLMERALVKNGVEVETLTTNDDGPGATTDIELWSPIRENGVIRRYFQKQREFYKVSFPLTEWVSQHVRDYDLLHIHALFSFTSNAAARIARKSGVPYVIRPLGVLNMYGMTQRRALLKRLSLRWVERPVLERASAVHLTSVQEKKEAESLGISFRSVVVPLGLEVTKEKNYSWAETDSVLFLSRLDPKKNVEGLLKAWAGCARKFTSWRLRIAGSGEPDYEKSLQKLTSDLGLEESVEWLGHLEGEEKEQALAEAGVFVLPSFSENFGIAAAEALFAGRACVFSPLVAVGASAIAAGAARLGGPDSSSLAESLKALMGNVEDRETLGRAGRAFAEKELSAETMGRRLRDLYESILAER